MALYGPKGVKKGSQKGPLFGPLFDPQNTPFGGMAGDHPYPGRIKGVIWGHLAIWPKGGQKGVQKGSKRGDLGVPGDPCQGSGIGPFGGQKGSKGVKRGQKGPFLTPFWTPFGTPFGPYGHYGQ